MKNTKKLLYVAASLELAGLAVVAFSASTLLMQPNAGAYSVPTPIYKTVTMSNAQPSLSGTPRTISVPSVGVRAQVQDGSYNANQATWTISENAAFFATLTDKANPTAGNTFIYGHNSDKIFGNLRSDLRTDARAYVTTDNGYEFTYAYKEAHDVDPKDVSTISPESDKPMLILQTCSGLFDETRRMVYFEYVSHKKL